MLNIATVDYNIKKDVHNIVMSIELTFSKYYKTVNKSIFKWSTLFPVKFVESLVAILYGEV